MSEKVIVQTLIENIKTDVEMLETVEEQLEPLQRQKNEISARLKEHQKDASVLVKYADEEGIQMLEELGFMIPSSITGLNPVAAIALEIIVGSKDKKLTNDALYKSYEKVCKEQEEESVGYADFNIKCRPLFNSQKLVRTKGKDPKSSREDVISLNGTLAGNKESK